MPSPTPRIKKRPPQQPVQPEVVSPIWLLKAISLVVLVALLCAYLTFCLLFHHGQWQLVLHPTRTASSPQFIGGAPYQVVHFGPDETATPQLTGWWIPAARDGRYAQATILFLGGGDGSLADSIPTLDALHNLGINIFAFDYRGYGQSAATHPSQQSMTEDAYAAWQYLTTSRHVPEQRIVPYGAGVGASLATRVAAAHASTPALILDSPHADLLDQARNDPRTRMLPVRLLFSERFPLVEPLSALRTPKLLILRPGIPDAAFRTASDPKFIATLTAVPDALYAQILTRFLDQYLPAPANQLVPTTTPSIQNPQ